MSVEEFQAMQEFEGYDNLSLLGRGGMASVWRARQISLDREVAIKILNADQTQTDEDIDRFQSEARSAARMSHPGIVQVYDAFYRDGNFCLVMEYIDGYTVGSWIRQRGFLSQDEALFVARGVAEALGYAWDRQQLVHCDIKPDNIMIASDGTVKVMDFGLSRSLHSLQARRTEAEEMVYGTPAYMPPEQATGVPELTIQADMYALGASLYQACTGRRLFEELPADEVMEAQVNRQDAPPLERNSELSPFFCDFMERLLAKEPNDRYATWKDVVDAIDLVRQGKPDPLGPLDLTHSMSTIRRSPFRDQIRSLALDRLRRAAHSAIETTKARLKVRIKRRDLDAAIDAASPTEPITASDVKDEMNRTIRSHKGAFFALVGGLLLVIALVGILHGKQTTQRRLFQNTNETIETIREEADLTTPDGIREAILRIDEFLASDSLARIPALRDKAETLRQTFEICRERAIQAAFNGLKASVNPLVEAGKLREAADRVADYDGPFAAETAQKRADLAFRIRLGNYTPPKKK